MKSSLSVYVWDDGESVDRYTIAIEYPGHSTVDIFGCCTRPFHPQGIGQFSHSVDKTDFTAARMKHLGKLLNYTALIPEVQKYIRVLINLDE